jgi:hypothetical protein
MLERLDIIRQVMPMRNRAGDGSVPADETIGTEFLQLVRFGLRDAGDPLILASIRIADALLKTDTPCGPVWHRYNGDGYDEHDDGSAYDGTGRGRGWPLLIGERGHYELAAGRDALPYLDDGDGEPRWHVAKQVWDADPIPSRRLAPGRPTGSAMPLVWAHAEFIKLLISRQVGQPIDRPRSVWRRYRGRRPTARHAFWWLHAPIDSMLAGRRLAMTPRPVAVGFAAPIAGRLVDRGYPAGILGGIGLATLSLGLVLLALHSPHAAVSRMVWWMAICGVGFGFFQTPNNRTILASAPPERTGSASGILTTARLVGQTLGAALVGLIFALTSASAGGVGRGATLALLVGAGFAAAGAIASSLPLFGFRQAELPAPPR